MLTEVHFAVKTCLQFHNTRCMRLIILKLLKIFVQSYIIVPVVKGTWAEDADSSISYYSDSEDPSLSTIDIGVPNTERGQLCC